MTSEGLGEMFEGDSADTCAGKFPLMSMEKMLKMQTYLEPNKYSIDLNKSIFLIRSRMLEIGENLRRKKKKSECPLCKDKNSPDSQAHLLMCPELDEIEILKKKVEYDDLFYDTLEDKVQVAQIIMRKFKSRKISLKKRKTCPHCRCEPCELDIIVLFCVLQYYSLLTVKC